MNKNNAGRQRLKATIEANRISRLSQKAQDDLFKELKEKKKTATGANLERISILIDVISDKQEQADEARINQTYAEYTDGNGYGSGAGSGNDSG